MSNINFKAFLPVVVLLVFWFIPAPEGLSVNAWHFLAIFFAVVVGLIIEPVPAALIGFAGISLVALLGYECEGYFSSSFKNNPSDIKNETIKKAIENIDLNADIFSKLSNVSDNMIIFNAGFILGSRANNLKVILAGGTQMASVLLTVNSILRSMDGVIDSSNIALCTTKWINKDEKSNIKALLEQLDFSINAYSSDFDFALSSHPALKLYDEGEAKEGVGCGGALCYASINGLTKSNISDKKPSFFFFG